MRLLRKFKFAGLLCSVIILTACSNEINYSATTKEVVGETTVISTPNFTVQYGTEVIANTAAVPEKETVSLQEQKESINVDELAHSYAKSLIKKLENQGDKIEFRTVGMNSDDIIGMRGCMSSLYLIDIDFDGIPELFAGNFGNLGVGTYDIYKSDGTLIYTLFNIEAPGGGEVFNNTIYYSTYNGFAGRVKVAQGLPSLQLKSKWPSEEDTADVEITTETGDVIIRQGINYDEFRALFTEYLGAEYDLLYGECEKNGVNVSMPNGIEKTVPNITAEQYKSRYSDNDVKLHGNTSFYPSVSGYLRVPDPENYTEEDVYNCLVELLSEYEKISRLQEE